MPPLRDLTNQRFGFLTVLGRAGTQNGHATWMCQCDCGVQKEIVGSSLLNGSTKSCGCKTSEFVSQSKIQHGMSNSRLYRIWQDMKRRCNNPHRVHYNSYGGRGITVCDEWMNSPQLFFEWAMQNGYSDHLTLDRIDVNGNYEPRNCRWISRSQQGRNKRNNHRVSYERQLITMADAADLTAISYSTLRSRLNELHWTEEDAMSFPPQIVSLRRRDDMGRFICVDKEILPHG